MARKSPDARSFSGISTPHLRLRIDPRLLERLEKSRDKNGRTLTGEIVHRLEQSFQKDDTLEQAETIATRIAKEILFQIFGGPHRGAVVKDVIEYPGDLGPEERVAWRVRQQLGMRGIADPTSKERLELGVSPDSQGQVLRRRRRALRKQQAFEQLQAEAKKKVSDK
jgi:hypothetical protein